MSAGAKFRVTAAVRASNLPTQARCVMFVLAEHSRGASTEIPVEYAPSLSALADECGMSRSGVKRYLVMLETHGWIVRLRNSRPGTSAPTVTAYRIEIGSPVSPELGSPMGQGDDEPREPRLGPPVGLDLGSNSDEHLPSLTGTNNQHSLAALDERVSSPGQMTLDGRVEPPPELVIDFTEFWAAYPRRAGKIDAEKAWGQALRKGAKAADILRGAHRYAKDPNLPAKQFIPLPATWLRRGSWDDEPMPERIEQRNGHRERTPVLDMATPWEGRRDD